MRQMRKPTSRAKVHANSTFDQSTQSYIWPIYVLLTKGRSKSCGRGIGYLQSGPEFKLCRGLLNFFQARALLLPLDHLDDELLHVGVARRLDVAGLNRLAVALQRAPLGQLVELRPVDLDEYALILGEVLPDLGPRQLNPVELDVPSAFQLE